MTLTLDFEADPPPAASATPAASALPSPAEPAVYLAERLRAVGWPNPEAEAGEMLAFARESLRRYPQDRAHTWLYGPLPNGPGLCRLVVPRDAVFPKRKPKP